MNTSATVRESKQSRMFYDGNRAILSDRQYNLVIGGTILYGIIINVLMCLYLTPVIAAINPLVLLIAYFVCAIAGSMITYRSDTPAISFLGYNLVVVPMGAVLAICLQGVAPGVVIEALLLTGVITAVMLLASAAYPGVFAGMGRMLFTALIGILVAQIICMLFSFSMTILSWAAAVIFSLYIGYDWLRAQMYVKTLDHAIDSALDIYMDIINLFLRLVSILGRRD